MTARGSTDFRWAVALFAVALAVTLADVDPQIAAAWAFDEATQSFPARQAFWTTTLIHSGGRAFVWALGLTSVFGLIASLWSERLAALRGRFIVGLFGLVQTTLLIGALKQLTHMDCPWDVAGLGGSIPHFGLFEARPIGLPAAACFPAAHAGSGFALLSLYFAWRDTRLARPLLVLALLTGVTFAIAQEARGAHFLSHDLWSLAIAWSVCSATFAFVSSPRLNSETVSSHAHDHRIPPLRPDSHTTR